MTAIENLDIPAWCGWKRGASRIVVLAPHGGARAHAAAVGVPRRGDKPRKINDLHTAELAATLAGELDASYLINSALDRNTLDLNRISQVRRRAPWFLQILAGLVEAAVRRHGEAYLLVVHGWNVNQQRCDIGVGADLTAAAADHSQLTVSAEFLDRHLRPLSEGEGSGVTLGRRYPARHRNNLLQLFRRDGTRADDLPAPLADIVRAGRCEAVQLELGIPLRWPGRASERFVGRLARAFGPRLPVRPLDSPRRPAPTVRAKAAADDHRPSRALQAFDPESGVAILASIDAFPGFDTVFGRVAVFLPDGGVGLYTGEARDDRELARDGPHFLAGEHQTTLNFDGSVLLTADGDDYVDLERALARSTLADMTIRLVHQRGAMPRVGQVAGHVTIDGRELAVNTTGFSAAREWGHWRRAERAQWSVRAAFDRTPATVLRSTSRRRDSAAIESTRVLLADDRYSPRELMLETRDGAMRVRPLSRMSIARPIGAGRRARVTFGPATIELLGSDERGFGLFEYARLIDR